MYNNESDLILRLQDKGNRFVIVDKETDQRKAREQIARSFLLNWIMILLSYTFFFISITLISISRLRFDSEFGAISGSKKFLKELHIPNKRAWL